MLHTTLMVRQTQKYHHPHRLQSQRRLLPVSVCAAKDPNSKGEFRAPRPFEINIKFRGTAAIIEWVSVFVSILQCMICMYHTTFSNC